MNSYTEKPRATRSGSQIVSNRTSRPGTQLERVPVYIFDESVSLSRQVARRIARLIEEGKSIGKNVVLGLPTGMTPIGVYKTLIQMHKEEGLDFSNVITFNIDEYYPIDPASLQSCHLYMKERFFDHVNIPPENIHIPRGDLQPEEIDDYCSAYEHAIAKAGGLDLVMLGIGRSGRVGDNEPGSAFDTRMRLIVLDEITRKDATSDFFGEDNVPRQAITLGVGTILEAREVVLLAIGEHKAPIIKRAVEGEPNKDVVASYLQLHPTATFYVDRAAASMLTREATPWLVRNVEWDADMAKRAVIWLSGKLGKSIMTLEKADFYRNHLHDLIYAYGGIDKLCRFIFEDLRRRIRYSDELPSGKRTILFSPHPDDDVISMGGMFYKFVANGNDVTVAYMTNGSVAVFDEDVRRYLRFVAFSMNVLGLDEDAKEVFEQQKERIFKFLEDKKPGEVDIPDIRNIKSYIRYAEAIDGIEVLGLKAEKARFLDMKFYRTGMINKDPIGPEDVQVVLDLLNEIEPHHIFVAGDLSDPHGTHRMCYVAIREALRIYNEQSEKAALNKNSADDAGVDSIPAEAAEERPLVWLYRGAWQEWEIYRTDIFLPLSKGDLDRKIEAIYRHESQKDRAMFPGAYDEREFWQRAKERNRNTAAALNALGLPEFYAAEAFVTTVDL